MSDYCYFNHASASHPKPARVVKQVADYLSSVTGVDTRGSSESPLEYYRQQIKEFLLTDIEHEDWRLIFTKNATEAANLALQGLDNQRNYILDSFSHNAVLRTCYAMQSQNKNLQIIIRSKSFSEYLINSIKKLNDDENTVLVITLVSNVTGELLEKELLTLLLKSLVAHDNLTIVLDCSQFFGNFTLSQWLPKLHNRLLLFGSGHKYLLGPEGVGFLLAHKDATISPLLFGGTGFNSANQKMPTELPYRLEAGTYPMTAITGLATAISAGPLQYQQQFLKRAKLAAKLLDAIQQMPNYTLAYSPTDIVQHSHAFTMVHNDYSANELSYQLINAYKIICRHGLFCAPLVFKELPTLFKEGALRMSLGYSNSEEEIEHLITALQQIH